MTPTLLEVDSRKRVALGPAATAKRYILEQDESGVIILTPAVVMSEEEARLMQRPDILAAVEESRRRSAAGEPGAGKPVRRKQPTADPILDLLDQKGQA